VTPMKTVWSLVLLAALAVSAQAQDTKQDTKTDKKPVEKPAPNLNGSPWSVDTVTKSDGYFGSSSTTIKRDMGEGWSLGGKMTTPYEDQKIGGSGAPGLKQYENPGRGTTFGPVLEKKF
jgi:hypothetical protein